MPKAKKKIAPEMITQSRRRQRELATLIGPERMKRIRSNIRYHKRVGPSARERIETAFLRTLGNAAACELAFHMLDWVAELRDLHQLIRKPDSFNDEQIRDVIDRFCIHAPHHMTAAHRIAMGTPVEDLFDLGAIKGDGIPKRRPGMSCPDGSAPIRKPTTMKNSKVRPSKNRTKTRQTRNP